MKNCVGFEWDLGNFHKNWDKHKVLPQECEQIFFNYPLLLQNDDKHSHAEERIYVLGKTDTERLLFAVFTIRNSLIRIISDRGMSKNECKIYEKEEITKF